MDQAPRPYGERPLLCRLQRLQCRQPLIRDQMFDLLCRTEQSLVGPATRLKCLGQGSEFPPLTPEPAAPLTLLLLLELLERLVQALRGPEDLRCRLQSLQEEPEDLQSLCHQKTLVRDQTVVPQL